MQINMAMREVGHMAHVEQFSNLVVPMLWFEIVSNCIIYEIIKISPYRIWNNLYKIEFSKVLYDDIFNTRVY